MNKRNEPSKVVDLGAVRREREDAFDATVFYFDAVVHLLAAEGAIITLGLDREPGTARALGRVHRALRDLSGDLARLRGLEDATIPELMNDEMDCIEDGDAEPDAVERLAARNYYVSVEACCAMLRTLQSLDGSLGLPVEGAPEEWPAGVRANAVAWLRLFDRASDAASVVPGIWSCDERGEG